MVIISALVVPLTYGFGRLKCWVRTNQINFSDLNPIMINFTLLILICSRSNIRGFERCECFGFILSSAPCYRASIIYLGPICIVVGTVKNKGFGVTSIGSMSKPVFDNFERI